MKRYFESSFILFLMLGSLSYALAASVGKTAPTQPAWYVKYAYGDSKEPAAKLTRIAPGPESTPLPLKNFPWSCRLTEILKTEKLTDSIELQLRQVECKKGDEVVFAPVHCYNPPMFGGDGLAVKSGENTALIQAGCGMDP